jgi:hypothetical protein
MKIIKSICVRHNLLIYFIYFIYLFELNTITLLGSRLISYKTSGANETILVKFNCLNSRAIAPKTRVPFGFPS